VTKLDTVDTPPSRVPRATSPFRGGILLSLLLILPAFAQAAPQRIVSLNPCLDALLVEVADKNQIQAISHYSHDPRASSIPASVARRFGKTYGTAEDVLIQNPDLVLASSYTPPATRQALARLGIRLMLFDVPQNAMESLAQIRQIAEAVDQKPRGEALVARIERALNISPVPATPALIRSESGFVLGTGTVMDDLLRRSGFTNISTSMGLSMSDMLPLEALLLHPPALLFSMSDTDSPRAHHPVLHHLAQRITIKPLPSRLVNCAGPTIIDAMDYLVAARKTLP
jgi:iron complex transport system substrate-binding protein